MEENKNCTCCLISSITLPFLLVVFLVPVVGYLGTMVFFYFAFSQEKTPDPNYNPTSLINEQYEIEIPLDAEIKYRAYTVWAGFSGDGFTYCVYDLGDSDIKGVNWCLDKNTGFETKVDGLLDSLNNSRELLDYDANFKLEHIFDWSNSYKWFSKVQPFSSTEFVENEIVDSIACELYLYYSETTKELFLLEFDL